jgi:hypothetical protein
MNRVGDQRRTIIMAYAAGTGGGGIIHPRNPNMLL